jgi:predicted amidophosphoribosyltransferase
MCPVCQARFRGSTECSRCGADLGTIMGLAADAWRMREAARRAMAEGDVARARALAVQAQEFCRTPAGRQLEMVSSWLAGASPEMDKTAP